MSACNQVIQHIHSSFTIPKEIYRTLFHLPDVMLPSEKDIPPLEYFMNPEPDIEGIEESPAHSSRVSAENISVLGSYRCLQSPGLITLYSENLTLYFWRLALEIEKALPKIDWTEDDLLKLAEWTVDKTYWHERFHHSLDVIRHLLDVYHFDVWQEEALAVAYSRYYLQKQRQAPRYRRQNAHQTVIWEAFMELAYHYHSPGYRDWLRYADPIALKSGICAYLAPRNSLMLKSIRVSVADMLFEWLPVEGGFEECSQ